MLKLRFHNPADVAPGCHCAVFFFPEWRFFLPGRAVHATEMNAKIDTVDEGEVGSARRGRSEMMRGRDEDGKVERERT